MIVMIGDKAAFTGSYEECKEYITSRFTVEEYDHMGDLIDIIDERGRCASFVLEW